MDGPWPTVDKIGKVAANGPQDIAGNPGPASRTAVVVLVRADPDTRPLVVVTGGASRLANLVGPWLGMSYRLRIVGERPLSSAAPIGAEHVEVDLTSPHDLRLAMAGADAVVHLASDARPVAAPDEKIATVVELASTILEAAVQAGLERVVVASLARTINSGSMHDGNQLAACCAYPQGELALNVVGRFFARQSDMSVVCVRSCTVRESPPTCEPAYSWLCPRDFAEVTSSFVDLALEPGTCVTASAAFLSADEIEIVCSSLDAPLNPMNGRLAHAPLCVPSGRGAPPPLSPREHEVLTAVADGLTHRQIATRLKISPHTVETYIKRIKAKRSLGNKADMTRLALLEPQNRRAISREHWPN